MVTLSPLNRPHTR